MSFLPTWRPTLNSWPPRSTTWNWCFLTAPAWGSNLPSPATLARLAAVATSHGLTYTVHLPLDIRLGDDGSADHESLTLARRVILDTQALQPFGYVMHLDGRALMDEPTTRQRQRWEANALRALELLVGWAGSPELLCVENVEGWDPDWLTPISDGDAGGGHGGHRPSLGAGRRSLAYLRQWEQRTRVVHLHGLADRDHSSLAHMSPVVLDPVVAWLAQHFAGVVTLEVFGMDDYVSSRRALAEALVRLGYASGAASLVRI